MWAKTACDYSAKNPSSSPSFPSPDDSTSGEDKGIEIILRSIKKKRRSKWFGFGAGAVLVPSLCFSSVLVLAFAGMGFFRVLFLSSYRSCASSDVGLFWGCSCWAFCWAALGFGWLLLLDGQDVIAGHKEVVKKLVNLMTKEELALKNQFNSSAVFLTAVGGFKDMAEELVKKNPDLVRLKSGGRSLIPVIVASLYGSEDAVRYLYSKTPHNLLDPNKDENEKSGATLLNALIIQEMNGGAPIGTSSSGSGCGRITTLPRPRPRCPCCILK
ncbi:hypothetical protein L1049_019516 [Liquidambar formosana]|uniref:Uncharacterized protein n=1 Tax=Liquidambar formosana TaxID=63359 RepID=A0AAP0S898_LIQFO